MGSRANVLVIDDMESDNNGNSIYNNSMLSPHNNDSSNRQYPMTL